MPDATRRLPRCCILCCFARRSVVYFDQTSRRSCRGRFVRAGANLRRRLTGDGDRDRLARCHYCPSVRTHVRPSSKTPRTEADAAAAAAAAEEEGMGNERNGGGWST